VTENGIVKTEMTKELSVNLYPLRKNQNLRANLINLLALTDLVSRRNKFVTSVVIVVAEKMRVLSVLLHHLH
jgi:hypothetical protein